MSLKGIFNQESPMFMTGWIYMEM